MKRAARQRTKKAKEREKEDWRKGGRKRYAWIKGRPRSTVGAVRTEEGQVVTEPTEMAEHIAKAWQKIYEEPSGVNVEDFMAKYGDYVIKGPRQTARKLTVEDYRRKLREANPQRAAAADGWKVKDARELPDALLQIVVELIEEAEAKGGDWPKIITTGITTCARKEDEEEEAEEDEEGLIVVDAGATRPITNCSLWLTTWDALRYEEVEAIRDSMPQSMHGARTGHERHQVSLQIALELEYAHLANEVLVGLNVDKKKKSIRSTEA